MKAKKTEAFGVETSFEEADLILIPVPWEGNSFLWKRGQPRSGSDKKSFFPTGFF